MRLINLVVFCIILAGVMTTGSCLFAVHVGAPKLEAYACPALGPGLLTIAASFFISLYIFVIGFALRVIRNEFSLANSLYTFNLLFISVVLFVLFVEIPLP